MWNLETKEQIGKTLKGHPTYITQVIFHPDGEILASSSEDGTVYFWDLKTTESIGDPIRWKDPVSSIFYSHDGKTLAVADASGAVCILPATLENDAIDKNIESHFAGIVDISLSPDGKVLAAIDTVGDFRLWDATNAEAIKKPSMNLEDKSSILYSPNGKVLAVGTKDKSDEDSARSLYTNLSLWDIEEDKFIKKNLIVNKQGINDFVFSPDGEILATSSNDRTIQLWSTKTGEPALDPLVGHEDSVRILTFSSDGNALASSSKDETVRLWNPKTGEPIGTPLGGHTKGAGRVAYSPDGKFLISKNIVDGIFYLWDAETKKLIHEIESLERFITFSCDSKVIIAYTTNSIELWDTNSRDLIKRLTAFDEDITSVAVSPTLPIIAVSDNQGSIFLCDVKTGEMINKPLIGHIGAIKKVAFKSDGKTLFSAGQDRTIRLWDVETGRLISLAGAVQTAVFGAKFVNNFGLSEKNKTLLQQRGATVIDDANALVRKTTNKSEKVQSDGEENSDSNASIPPNIAKIIVSEVLKTVEANYQYVDAKLSQVWKAVQDNRNQLGEVGVTLLDKNLEIHQHLERTREHFKQLSEYNRKLLVREIQNLIEK